MWEQNIYYDHIWYALQWNLTYPVIEVPGASVYQAGVIASWPFYYYVRWRHDWLAHSVKMASRKSSESLRSNRNKDYRRLKGRKVQRLVGDIHGVPKSTIGDYGRIEGKSRSTCLRAIVLPLLGRGASSEKHSSRSWRRHATHGSCNSALRVLQCQGPYWRRKPTACWSAGFE